jgi:hypothetical protein
MRKQWHPLFVSLLRAQVEPYYEVLSEYAVSELPRRVDVLLLRRRHEPADVFDGMWNELTLLNALEYKSPLDTANTADFTRLLAVGAGALYRLQEEANPEQPEWKNHHLSLWLLAPQITAELQDELYAMGLRPVADTPGLWRGRVGLFRTVVLEYNRALVDLDTLPVHLLTTEVLYQDNAMRLLRERPALVQRIKYLLQNIDPVLWKDLIMAQSAEQSPFRWQQMWETVLEMGADVREALAPLTPEQRLKGLTPEQRLKGLAPEQQLKGLTPEQRLAGLAPEQRLAGLSDDEILTLLQKRKSAPPAS